MNHPDLDYRAILDDFARVPDDIARLVDCFLAESASSRLYLLGRNEHALALSETIAVAGFVDDFADEGSSWLNKPIIRSRDLAPQDVVVNCSMSIAPLSARARLDASRCKTVLNLADLYRAKPDLFALPGFVQGARADFLENETKILRVYNNLADAQSRQTMRALAGYRLTGHPNYMRGFSVRLPEQYFEAFLDLTEPTFVDAGGFDGDTTQEFCKRYPDYKKVYLFEPCQTNVSAARTRLADYRDIEFIQLGLSDSSGILRFNPDAGSASSIASGGSASIEVTTLDSQIAKPVSFIKMDLEGWELKALQGAKRHIMEYGPALAISVYHKPSDYWQIYDFIHSIRNDYRVYLRHYTEGWSETVMFFVPD